MTIIIYSVSAVKSSFTCVELIFTSHLNLMEPVFFLALYLNCHQEIKIAVFEKSDDKNKCILIILQKKIKQFY